MNHDPLRAITESLLQKHCVIPVIGIELEFYTDTSRVDELAHHIEPELLSHEIALTEWKAEDGAGQWEVALAPATPKKALTDYANFMSMLERASEMLGITIDRRAKPVADQPSSGLHLHLHLENEAGEHLFTKEGDAMSDYLSHALGGMLRMMPASMPFFMPSETSYQRFLDVDYVPHTISWGMNNRTVALRIPENREPQKRVEHRVCGADANVEHAMWALLVGVEVGLSEYITAPDAIYGNANDLQYGLPQLPRNTHEAWRAYQSDELMQRYAKECGMEAVISAPLIDQPLAS